jgi:hypothetical protein
MEAFLLVLRVLLVLLLTLMGSSHPLHDAGAFLGMVP